MPLFPHSCCIWRHHAEHSKLSVANIRPTWSGGHCKCLPWKAQGRSAANTEGYRKRVHGLLNADCCGSFYAPVTSDSQCVWLFHEEHETCRHSLAVYQTGNHSLPLSAGCWHFHSYHTERQGRGRERFACLWNCDWFVIAIVFLHPLNWFDLVVPSWVQSLLTLCIP